MLAQIVQRARRWLHVLAHLDLLESFMAADRDLIESLAALIPTIVDGVDQLVTDRNAWRDRALAAEGAAVTDEADDLAALTPLRDGLAALAAKLAPAAPEVEPVPVEELPGAVDAVPDPAPAEQAPAEQAPSEQPGSDPASS